MTLVQPWKPTTKHVLATTHSTGLFLDHFYSRINKTDKSFQYFLFLLWSRPFPPDCFCACIHVCTLLQITWGLRFIVRVYQSADLREIYCLGNSFFVQFKLLLVKRWTTCRNKWRQIVIESRVPKTDFPPANLLYTNVRLSISDNLQTARSLNICPVIDCDSILHALSRKLLFLLFSGSRVWTWSTCPTTRTRYTSSDELLFEPTPETNVRLKKKDLHRAGGQPESRMQAINDILPYYNTLRKQRKESN